jgi:hypothetical protein
VVLTVSSVFPKLVSSGSGNLLATLFVGEMALMGTGLLQLALAAEALFSSSAQYAYSPLIVSGILALALMHALDVYDREDRKAEELDTEDEEEDDLDDAVDEMAEPEAQTSAIRKGIAWIALLAWLLALYLAPVLFWLVSIFWVYGRLRAESFEGYTFGFEAELPSYLNAFSVAAPEVARTLTVLLVVGAVLYFIYLVFRWISRLIWPHSNRELSDAEIDFILNSEQQIRDHIIENNFKRSPWLSGAYLLFLVVSPMKPCFSS